MLFRSHTVLHFINTQSQQNRHRETGDKGIKTQNKRILDNIDVALRTIINLLVEKGIISKQEFLEKSKHTESNDTYKHFYENKDAMLKQSELLQTVISKLKQDS